MISPGTRLGPYVISAPIGAGGMGEVYRATDTNLKRAVAVKVLPEQGATDRDRLARFQREAEVLGSLNHSNIAAIYGLERSNSVTALVMELVEGPTLADRIAQGPIPIDEALPIAKQIAEALEAAHEQGIIHRDLKPANIKLRPDGVVKVLDFGLAKALDSGPTTIDASHSPTIASPAMMTGVGVLLGTAAYMSPEQARGETIDRRTDMWAFGCVLYEMLTGRAPFAGGTATEVLACVLEREPVWSVVPAPTPASVCSLLRQCLVKARKNRLDSATAARLDIDHALVPSPRDVAHGRVAFPYGTAIIATALAVAFVALSAGWRIATREDVLAFSPIQFQIDAPADYSLWTDYNARNVAVSPDGSGVVFVATSADAGERQLFIRRLGDLEPTPLDGTAGARNPFFSPDGQWIAFFAVSPNFAGFELRKVSIAGGAPILICRLALANSGTPSGSWGADDAIVFSTGGNNAPLQIVAAAGGTPTTVAVPDNAKDELRFTFPEHISGRRAVLMNVHSMFGQDLHVDVIDLDSGRRDTVIPSGSLAQYADSGHLIYVAGAGLQAVRFDERRLAVIGDPVALPGQALLAGFSLSRGGTLAYLPGSNITRDGESGVRAGRQRALVWVDRNGRESPTNAPVRPYGVVRLAPDAKQAVVDIRQQTIDLWTWDFQRQTLSRITSDPADGANPVWIPGSQRIVYGGVQDGSPGLFLQQADGSGSSQRLTTTPFVQLAKAATPDGKYVLTSDQLPTGLDIGLVSLTAPFGAKPLIQSIADQNNPAVSPDGKWIAYDSGESGSIEIYVRPFPNVDAGRWQVSNAGGRQPVWASDGSELFYLDEVGSLISVNVQTTPTFAAGRPQKVSETRYVSGGARSYDVSPDGQRFLMLKDATLAETASGPAGIVVVLNWVEALKRLVPVN